MKYAFQVCIALFDGMHVSKLNQLRPLMLNKQIQFMDSGELVRCDVKGKSRKAHEVNWCERRGGCRGWRWWKVIRCDHPGRRTWIWCINSSLYGLCWKLRHMSRCSVAVLCTFILWRHFKFSLRGQTFVPLTLTKALCLCKASPVSSRKNHPSCCPSLSMFWTPDTGFPSCASACVSSCPANNGGSGSVSG